MYVVSFCLCLSSLYFSLDFLSTLVNVSILLLKESVHSWKKGTCVRRVRSVVEWADDLRALRILAKVNRSNKREKIAERVQRRPLVTLNIYIFVIEPFGHQAAPAYSRAYFGTTIQLIEENERVFSG